MPAPILAGILLFMLAVPAEPATALAAATTALGSDVSVRRLSDRVWVHTSSRRLADGRRIQPNRRLVAAATP